MKEEAGRKRIEELDNFAMDAESRATMAEAEISAMQLDVEKITIVLG